MKRLAEDAAFAQQFETATGSGDYAQATALVSSATGVDRGSIRVGPKGLAAAPEPITEPRSMVSLASLREPRRAPSTVFLSGKVCFDFGVVQGCIAF